MLSVLVPGVRSDLSAIGWLVSPCFLVWFLLGGTRLHAPASVFTRILLFAVLSAAVILEVTTGPFLEEYGVRPNRLYVEYLIYPKEVTLDDCLRAYLGLWSSACPLLQDSSFLSGNFSGEYYPQALRAPVTRQGASASLFLRCSRLDLRGELSATGRSIRPISHSAQTRC